MLDLGSHPTTMNMRPWDWQTRCHWHCWAAEPIMTGNFCRILKKNSVCVHYCKSDFSLICTSEYSWFRSVQFGHSIMSDSLRPHGLQHTRPPCPSPVPGVYITGVSDAIQPSHPLSYPSPPALNLSQHQGLFQRVNSSHQVTKVLEFQLQHQSFQRTPRTDDLL